MTLGSSRHAPESYVIDVCATCGRQAVYPFSCGHRRLDRAWTAPIVVKPSRAVQTAINLAARP